MQKQAFIGPALGGALINVLTNVITDRLIQKPSVPVDRSNVGVVRPEIREAVQEAITKDPVIVNELNAEPPSQSRVVWGSTIAAIGSFLAGILPVLVALGLITQEQSQAILEGWAAIVPAIGAIMALGGAIYSLYGRLAKGLKPLFSGKKLGA